MEETNTTPTLREREGLSLPDDFSPYIWADVVKGATEAIHYYVTEGPAVESPMPAGTLASMEGLAYVAMRFHAELHEYLYQVENLTDIRLPRSNEDFDEHWRERQATDGVREAPALYAI
jgi:hypothetical protein